MKEKYFWIRLCIFNFLIVSLLGVIMRYNLLYPINGVEHKFFRFSHSHFAFYGWVTALLYFLVAEHLRDSLGIHIKKYKKLMVINQIASYGMMFSFMYRGYFWLSIIFATLALCIGFAYFSFIMKDTKGRISSELPWLRMGSFSALFSAIGIFVLAYIMASKKSLPELYRAATYFYMHFQYNGFFLLSCIGIMLISLRKKGIQISEKANDTAFHLLTAGTLVGYGLSVLWLRGIPTSVSIFLGFVAIAQLYGFGLIVKLIKKHWPKISEDWSAVQKLAFLVSGTALILKFLFQSISVIPAWAFIFDNLNFVIGFLHLVLLMGISLFLIWKILEIRIFELNKGVKAGIYLMIFGIILNEIILGIAGLYPIPYLLAPKGLLLASLIIMTALIILNLSIRRNKKQP